ncbi:MAG: asparagine synthase (glutamine-hydrolyzing) [Candidatus Aenigmatarchaeota archaeon]
MSGIAGVCDFSKAVEKKMLRNMIGIIRHRGKDGLSIFIDDNIGLAHCLMSMGEKAKRPIINESGSLLLVFDGLIYNLDELKSKLKKHRFSSNAEEEVIVHLYEEYGTSAVKMIDGDFAFALWDNTKKELILARDGFGARPMFYTIVEGKILFASEIKSLLAAGIRRGVNIGVFYRYFNHLETQGSETMFAGVEKILPGQLMVYGRNGMKLMQYLDISFYPKVRLSEDAIVKKTSALLDESVLKRVRKSRNYGVALSGGLDALSLITLIKKIDDSNIDTYTLECGRSLNEVESARKIAEFFGTDHHEITIEPEHINLLPKIFWHAEDGRRFATSYLFDYMLSHSSRKNKILFYGWSSEALFGNKMFTWVNRTRLLREIPHAIRKRAVFLRGVFPKKTHAFIFSRDSSELFMHSPLYFFTENEKQKLFKRHFNHVRTKKRNSLEDFNYTVFKNLTQGEMYSADGQCSANAQQFTAPFVDRNLADFVCKVPSSMRFRGYKQKYLLKRCMENKIPKDLLSNKGPVTLHFYLPKLWCKEHKDILQQLILRLSKRDYFMKGELLKILEGADDNCFKTWELARFELWNEIFIDCEKIKEPKSLKEFL